MNAAVLLAAFVATAVEVVETLTVVLAVGVTRGWRSALAGVGSAAIVLAVPIVVVGAAVQRYVPLDALRLVAGAGALYVGSTWLRKAVLRASGRKAHRDENRAYEKASSAQGRAFALTFQAGLTEGFEVFCVVLAVGSGSHTMGTAWVGAGAAILVVSVVGGLVARPLARVPENALKMTVALTMCPLGSFWVGEGLGLSWPLSDGFLLVLVGLWCLATWVAVRVLRRDTVVLG